jgi:hypothetical protein
MHNELFLRRTKRMKKITGKALSLVLSLALVVSSFSATFANAATTKNEYLPTVNDTDTVVRLANGKSGASSLTNITSTVPFQISNVATLDNLKVTTPLSAVDIAYKSGANLVTPIVDKDHSQIQVKLNNDNATGTEVIAVRYAVTGKRYTDLTADVQFSVEADYTVKVYQNDSYIISASGSTDKALADVTKDSGTSFTGYVDKVSRSASDCTAVFAPMNVCAKTKSATDSTLDPSGLAKDVFMVKDIYSNSSTKTANTDGSDTSFTVTLSKLDKAEFLNLGTIAIYATPVVVNNGVSSLNTAKTITATPSVVNKVALSSDYKTIKTWHGSTWAVKDSSAFPAESSQGVQITGTSIYAPATDAINVTGADVQLGGDVSMESGYVTKVTASTASSFTLDGGNVASIDDDSHIAFTMTNGTVGSVKVKTATVDGGTTGAITAGTVTLNALDEKVPTKTGAIKAETVTIDSDKAAVTTGAITEDGVLSDVAAGPQANSAQSIMLMGSSTTVASIDLAYYNATVELKGFTGSIAAPANAANGSIVASVDTDNTKTTATVTGAVVVDTVRVDDGTLTIANTLNVGTVTGAGTLVVPANAMYIKSTINSIKLKLSNATLTPGMTAFTAAAYKVYDGMFTPVGFTIDYDAVSAVTGTRTTDTFKIKSVNFAGLTIVPATGTSNKIVKGDKATFNVSTYPAGTKLPDGKSIQITFSGSSDNFSCTTTANSITITANKYDDLFASLNKGTITATLIDTATGAQDYTVDPATYDVQMIKTPEVSFKSDTTGNLNKKIGETYQFKITSADGSAPVFAVASNGATVVANGKSGNDYFFKVTPTKVGSFGVYVSGTKVAVLVVTSGVKCDTSKVTVAAGKTYQFKVTASAQPTFVVATVGTIKLASKNGNDYFYKVTATKTAGAHGVYINGVLTAVITFA